MRQPLAVLYDVPLPNRYAATIQMLRTLAPMAAAGRAVSFVHARPTEPSGVTLARLGLEAVPNLTLEAAFAPIGWPGPLRAVVRRRVLAGFEKADGVVLSRGETGMAALPRLAQRRQRPLLLYEVHRLAGNSVQEREIGRSVRPGDEQSSAARTAAERDLAAARAADAHVFLTEAVRDAARAEGWPERPSIVLPSGTAMPPRSTTSRDLDVVYAGKLEARKGLPDLLAAMVHAPGYRLDIAGGSEAEIARARRNAPAGVTFHGWLGQPDVSALMARGRIGACLLPAGHDSVSDRFSSPMKLLDMMAHGLAVVATATPAVRAVATDGENALLVPPGEPTAAAAAIERLMKDEGLRTRLGEAARLTASGYDWTRRAERLGGFVDELAASHETAAMRRSL